MPMFKRFTILAILLFGLFTLCYADMGDEATLGGLDSDGYYRWRVNSSGHLIPGTDNSYNIGGSSNQVKNIYYNGVLTPGTSASIKVNYEVFTTDDTLTSTDSGKVLIAKDTSGVIFTLPTSAVGLQYTFSNGSAKTLVVDPGNTVDRIVYSTTMVGGDSIKAVASGDTLSLVCGVSGYWYVTSMSGTWSDAN